MFIEPHNIKTAMRKYCQVLILCISTIGYNVTSSAASDLPNVIIFFADDAGYADFGFQGSEIHVTPNIDFLAKHGVVFSQAYASSSVCSPSRAGLLTGRYQNRFGMEFNLPHVGSNHLASDMPGLPLSEVTIADLVKSKGYATAMIGKWHLGATDEFLPDSRGFDEYFGVMGGSSGYRTGTAKNVISNYLEVKSKSLPYLTDAFGDQAVDFIRNNKEQPFFLYFAFTAPHGPMHAKSEYLEKFLDKTEDPRRAANAALTRSMDDNIGKVLKVLKDFDLYDNTFVIFANDNGGEPSKNGASNSPLNGVKGTVLEGGIKIPLIFHWSNRITGNQLYNYPVTTLDVLPTVMNAIGADINVEIDGVDLLPYIGGENHHSPHETLYWRVNWGAAIRDGDWKLIRTPKNENRLFNLANDPEEIENLIEMFPDKAASSKQKLLVWEGSLPEPKWEPKEFWKKSAASLY